MKTVGKLKGTGDNSWPLITLFQEWSAMVSWTSFCFNYCYYYTLPHQFPGNGKNYWNLLLVCLVIISVIGIQLYFKLFLLEEYLKFPMWFCIKTANFQNVCLTDGLLQKVENKFLVTSSGWLSPRCTEEMVGRAPCDTNPQAPPHKVTGTWKGPRLQIAFSWGS